ncbi:MAG: amidophosphoribosyltransferase [Spirochaetales bacterium]|nr:amidophosphoribosyltransferase [Spirochaetales bacterium]
MGGFFGVASKRDCVEHLFYGTDYHSHLGTRRGGLATFNGGEIIRHIHDITNAQFKSKFESCIATMKGTAGIGIISDYEDQPLIIGSHLGTYAIVTVGAIKNLSDLASSSFQKRTTHFSEMSGGEINPTELVATLINEAPTFEEGIRNVFRKIEGSCSLLILTGKGVYAARDSLGRTPLVIGRKEASYAVSFETSVFPNLDYETVKYCGPGEVVLITPEGFEQCIPPGDRLQICSFLWVYYGYPSSHYEGINVEAVRNRCGAALARNDNVEADIVAGIPDSGTGHAIGYANEAKLPYQRPYVKYTPTWPRSFMPQNQEYRDLVARMKLIPIRELIMGKRIVFCEDSIVRGTQLKDIIQRLYDAGAKEVHMRPACPPLIYGCKFLNFSRSRSDLDLAARRAIKEIEGNENAHCGLYARTGSPQYGAMVESIRRRLKLTSLRYQTIGDLIGAIGLPKEKLCTYCWDGVE